MSKHNQPNKAPQRADEKPDEARRFAADLMGHSFWAGVTFVVLMAVAGGIELFGRLLIYLHVFETDGAIAKISHAAALVLAGIDFAFLIAVVVKKGLAYLKGS